MQFARKRIFYSRVSLPSDFTGQSPLVCDLISRNAPLQYTRSHPFTTFGFAVPRPGQVMHVHTSPRRQRSAAYCRCFRKLGHFVLMPSRRCPKCPQTVLPHLRCARASVLGFLPFTLHDTAPVRGFPAYSSQIHFWKYCCLFLFNASV